MTDAQYAYRLDRLRQMIERRLRRSLRRGSPHQLNEACRYVLDGGGKRLRGVLVILGCRAVGGRAERALDAGAAVEIMHNFTLVHDDIMDSASSRHGRPTVHIYWDLNGALLTGDVLLGAAYEALLRTRHAQMRSLLELFTQGLIGVCRGQALDLEFALRSDVTVREYFGMIEQKTARLISMAAELGGMLGRGTPRQLRALKNFGHHLGRAFQLQDDLLDVVAEEAQLGKSIGGDIIERKRTYLLLTALRRARGGDRRTLEKLLRLPPGDRALRTGTGRAQTIASVTGIYRRLGVLEDARLLVRRNTSRALEALADLPPNEGHAMLRWLAERLGRRAF
jgi:geranylgeranyl diphosphate synthase type II